LRPGTFGQHLDLSAQDSQSCLRAKKIIVPSFVSPSRGLEKARWYFFQFFAAGADIEVAFGIVGEVAAGKVPSVRSALSISFTWGSIPRSSTSHPTISAEP
jgi:hypothetical protein